jgi:hypothetical protein
LIVAQAPGPEGNGTMGKIDAPYHLAPEQSGTSRHHGRAKMIVTRLGNCPPTRRSWRAYS